MWVLYILILTPLGHVSDVIAVRVADQEACEVIGHDLTQLTETMTTHHCVDLTTLLPEVGETG